jgi:hypothetical protein
MSLVILKGEPNKEKKRTKKKERRAGRRKRPVPAEIILPAPLWLRGDDPSRSWSTPYLGKVLSVRLRDLSFLLGC